ncbi:MAG: DoxX family protein [Opitutales bacterium]
MDLIESIIQLIIPLGIINVWLLRSKQRTTYRGKDAAGLKEEFAAYGLPEWMFYTVGALKLSAAAMLLLGFFLPVLVLPGAALMAVLMLGAVAMHAKVGDPPIRYLPAGLMLIMSLILVLL